MSFFLFFQFMESQGDAIDFLIGGDDHLKEKYQFLQKIGEGCFGKLYKVRNIRRNEVTALKIEYINQDDPRGSTLMNEKRILKRINGKQGVPRLKGAGRWKYGFFVEIQLLCSSLYDQKHYQYSLPEIISMAKELIDILMRIHDQGIIHQDLKPQNIMRDFNGRLMIIDYGLSHIKSKYKETVSGFIGTPRYASIAAHKNFAQNKKDDIESLFYVLAFMYLKKLPWFKLNIPKEQKLDEIQALKETSKEMFKQISFGFYLAYDYLRELKKRQQLNYELLISLLVTKQRNSTFLSSSVEAKEPLKNRRNSDFNSIKFEGIPSILISEIQIKNKEYKIPQNIQNYSEMAQAGHIEVLKVLTEKFFSKFQDEDLIEENNQISQTIAISQEPSLENMAKYTKSINLKNPFINNKI